MTQQKRIVVTGGAGFIGSALIWKLNQQGISNILVVDAFDKSEKWKNLAPLHFNDYQEKDSFIKDITAGKYNNTIDAVFHLGACSSTTETDARYLALNNFEYTKQLAIFCSTNNIRFIYASSAATYGDGSNGYTDEESQMHTLCPLNMYALSKKMFDIWAFDNGLLSTIVGLKYFNVFGPNEYHKADMRSMICKGYQQIIETGKIKLFKSYHTEYADGEQVRDFIYVKDAVAMTLHFYAHRSLSGIYNIGSAATTSWNTLAAALFAALNKKTNIRYIDMPEILRKKYQYHTQANIQKLRAAGYHNEITPIADAIRDYVQNYLIPGNVLNAEKQKPSK